MTALGLDLVRDAIAAAEAKLSKWDTPLTADERETLAWSLSPLPRVDEDSLWGGIVVDGRAVADTARLAGITLAGHRSAQIAIQIKRRLRSVA